MHKGSRFQRSFGPGLQAVRDHIKPFLAIQICVVLAVVAYYQIPSFAEFAGTLASWKVAGGLVFSFLSTMVAGAVFPEVFKALTRDPRRLPFPEFAYMCLVFGGNGILVDVFYQLQSYLFGDEANFRTVAIKVFVDQAIASWLLFQSYFLLMMLFRRSGFNIARMRDGLRMNPFFHQIWPIMVVGWAFWIPALCGIYALPANLQFVLFLFVQAAWSLIVVHVAKSGEKRHA